MNNRRIILYGILAVVVLFLVITFNSLVDLKADVDLQYSQIEIEMQRRVDLIPNFVEVVKGYAEHEETVFAEIAEARSKLSTSIQTGDMKSLEEANTAFTSALSRLLVITENYPTLQASEHFTALQDELAGTENRIAISRENYNMAVTKYNRAIQKFPGAIFANMMGFEPAKSFKAAAGSEVAPSISFD